MILGGSDSTHGCRSRALPIIPRLKLWLMAMVLLLWSQPEDTLAKDVCILCLDHKRTNTQRHALGPRSARAGSRVPAGRRCDRTAAPVGHRRRAQSGDRAAAVTGTRDGRRTGGELNLARGIEVMRYSITLRRTAPVPSSEGTGRRTATRQLTQRRSQVNIRDRTPTCRNEGIPA